MFRQPAKARQRTGVRSFWARGTSPLKRSRAIARRAGWGAAVILLCTRMSACAVGDQDSGDVVVDVGVLDAFDRDSVHEVLTSSEPVYLVVGPEGGLAALPRLGSPPKSPLAFSAQGTCRPR